MAFPNAKGRKPPKLRPTDPDNDGDTDMPMGMVMPPGASDPDAQMDMAQMMAIRKRAKTMAGNPVHPHLMKKK